MRLFWIILAASLVAAVVIRGFYRRHRQRKQMHELARRHQLNYAPEDLVGVLERFSGLQLLNTGHSRHISHLVYGSIDGGLITLFRFSCEVGFGVNRSERQWWMVILETAQNFKPWRTMPIEFQQLHKQQAPLGRFQLETEHEDTLAHLRQAGVCKWLEQMPSYFQYEVRGPLLATAAPGREKIRIPERLLESVYQLSQFSMPQ
jgi:hypothetical protein